MVLRISGGLRIPSDLKLQLLEHRDGVPLPEDGRPAIEAPSLQPPVLRPPWKGFPVATVFRTLRPSTLTRYPEEARHTHAAGVPRHRRPREKRVMHAHGRQRAPATSFHLGHLATQRLRSSAAGPHRHDIKVL